MYKVIFRQDNLCCGGGSGLVASLDYADQRMAAGKPEADQIRAAGDGGL